MGNINTGNLVCTASEARILSGDIVPLKKKKKKIRDSKRVAYSDMIEVMPGIIPVLYNVHDEYMRIFNM